MKRVLGIMMSLLLLGCLFPVSVLAAQDSSQRESDLTVSIVTHKVTIACGENGSFTVRGQKNASSVFVAQGSDVVVDVSPQSGHSMKAPLVSGEVVVGLEDNQITLSNIQSDVVLVIDFQEGNLPAAGGDSDTITPGEDNSPSGTEESDATSTPGAYMGIDLNGDGQADANIDTDGDGVADAMLMPIVDGKAVISEEIMEKLMRDVPEKGEVVLLFDQLEKTVQTVELPVKSLEKMEEKQMSFFFALSPMEIALDAAAVATLEEKAAGECIQLKIEQVDPSQLDKNQQNAIEDKELMNAFLVTISCNGQYIEVYEEGMVTVRLPFVPQEGSSIEEYRVLLVTQEGPVEPVETIYENGRLVFTVKSSSVYAVVKTSAGPEELQPSDETESIEYTAASLMCPLISISVLCVIFFMVFRKRREEE